MHTKMARSVAASAMQAVVVPMLMPMFDSRNAAHSSHTNLYNYEENRQKIGGKKHIIHQDPCERPLIEQKDLCLRL